MPQCCLGMLKKHLQEMAVRYGTFVHPPFSYHGTIRTGWIFVTDEITYPPESGSNITVEISCQEMW